jgi:hypothetical protein
LEVTDFKDCVFLELKIQEKPFKRTVFSNAVPLSKNEFFEAFWEKKR